MVSEQSCVLNNFAFRHQLDICRFLQKLLSCFGFILQLLQVLLEFGVQKFIDLIDHGLDLSR